MGLIDVEEIPDTIQPYAFIEIGGGEGEIDGADAWSSFVARIILGIDVWATDNVGFFVEGGRLAADEDDIDGAGNGLDARPAHGADNARAPTSAALRPGLIGTSSRACLDAQRQVALSTAYEAGPDRESWWGSC